MTPHGTSNRIERAIQTGPGVPSSVSLAAAASPASANVVRLLLVAIGVTLCAAISLGALTTLRAHQAADHAVMIAGTFDKVIEALRPEAAAEQTFRDQPDGITQARLITQTGITTRLLAQIQANINPESRPAVIDLVQMHDRWVRQASAFFDPTEAQARHAAVERNFYAFAAAVADATRNQVVSAGIRINSAKQQTRLFVALAFAFIASGTVPLLASYLRRGRNRATITRLAEAAERVEQSERWFRGILREAPDLILLCDEPGRITYENAAAERLWLHPQGTLIGRPLQDLIHPADTPLFQEYWQQIASQAQDTSAPRRIELRFHDGNGTWRDAELIGVNLNSDDIDAIAVTIRDQTGHKAAEQTLARGVLHDPLTRLPNHLLARDRIAQALLNAARRHHRTGLLSIGLDPAGVAQPSSPGIRDTIILEAAARIRACLHPHETIARLDPTTFLVLRDAPTGPTDILPLAQQLAEQFTRPIQHQGGATRLDVAIGIAIGTPDRDTPDDLVTKAEFARHQVALQSVTRHVLFEDNMRAAALDLIELESDLAAAEFDHDMTIHYQPTVAIPTGAITGFEALVRWNHPTHGLISPLTFIPIAEATGAILPLGAWLLEKACAQTAEWQRDTRRNPPLILNVNLTARQFLSPRLLPDLAQALDRSGLAPACLQLEVTEATLMKDRDLTIRTLWQIKKLGIRVTVDDFGSGYSALAYLKQLPLDQLKIDAAVIRGIASDAENRAVVHAIIALGRSLGLDVTAEGVETAEQAALLQSWGFALGQGYYFGRPLDQAGTTRLLAQPTAARARQIKPQPAT